MGMRDALDVLQERPFRYQFLASATSVLGDNLVPVALAFAVLDITGSASDLGLVLGARTGALVVFMLVGGVWADRVPRQRLMMVSDLGRAATQGTLGLLLITGTAELWHFVVLEVLNGAASAFFQPAVIGLTPRTVSPARLQQANALLSFSYSSAAIVGPALAGVIVATLGSGWALAIDAMTFLISAMFLLKIRLPPSAQKVERKRFLTDLIGGWNEVRSRAWVWISILNFMIFQLLALPTVFVLGPFIAERSLGGAGTWAAIVTAGGIGSLVGDVFALNASPRRPLRASFLLGLLAIPMLVTLGTEAPLWMLIAASVSWGLCMSFANTLWFTVLQERIPDTALSRVSSFDWMGSTVLRPIGFAVVGPIAAGIGPGTTLIGAAIVLTVVELGTASLPQISKIQRLSTGKGPLDPSEPADQYR